MTLQLADVSAMALDARAARLETGTITVVSDGGTHFKILRLAPGTLVLEHHRVVTRAGKNGIAAVRLRKGTTVLVLERPQKARRASKRSSGKSTHRTRPAPAFTG